MPVPAINSAAVVTTAHSEKSEVLARAQLVAESCGLPFVRRRHLEPGVPALVMEAGGSHLELPDAVVRSHPGMGLVRVRRLVRGEEHDPIVDIGELREGDSLLDCTFGYGQDALVAAYAVGESGRVVGIEASPLLAGLAMGGVSLWPAPANAIMRRVEIRRADMRDYLKAAATASFDVVLLDPMFRHGRPAAPDFAVLRLLADPTPLSVEDIAEARRVARRWVIVKDGWPGLDLKRLDVPALPFRRSAEVVFGRIAGGR